MSISGAEPVSMLIAPIHAVGSSEVGSMRSTVVFW
jgi:hypothetical protein